MAGRGIDPWPLLAGALGGAVCLLGGMLLWVSVAPGSGLSLAIAQVLPLPAVYSAHATQALDREPADLSAAARYNDAAIRLAPLQAEAQLQRAYIAARRAGYLDGAGSAALSAAYDAAPFDHRLARWRIPFSLDQWAHLSPRNRRQALAETEVLWRSINERRWLRTLPAGVRSPSGRLAIQLQIDRLETASRAEARAAGSR